MTDLAAAGPRFLDAATVRSLGYVGAVHALQEALRAGLDSAADPPRSALAAPGGDRLLLMPSTAWGVGVKVVTGPPECPVPGRSFVQHGVYLLFDPDTMVPETILDGVALTNLRTPAVSLAAVRPVLSRAPSPTVVVYGRGTQGEAHLDALADLARHDDTIAPPGSVTFVVRQPSVAPPWRAGHSIDEVGAGTPAEASALRAADVVICATHASAPLFDSRLLHDDAVVISVGSHLAHLSEVDTALCGRATVVVEDAATALRENGAVVSAVAAGTLGPDALVTMTQVAKGEAAHRLDAGPVLFTGCGMAWQDLVVARAVARS